MSKTAVNNIQEIITQNTHFAFLLLLLSLLLKHSTAACQRLSTFVSEAPVQVSSSAKTEVLHLFHRHFFITIMNSSFGGYCK